jgi:three-Cys-motif partner protein
MAAEGGPPPWEEVPMFEAEERPPPPRGRAPIRPLWTEAKARLIARYLFLFVQITKRGTYIDGFAGPQYPDRPELWAARLVLDSRAHEPWLRQHHLFEIDRGKLEHLEALRAEHPDRVAVYDDDFNEGVHRILKPEILPPAVPAFCLIDQQTFECAWATVEAVAAYKEPFRIEQFYFLAAGWMDRALAAQKDQERLRTWWGREDYGELRGLSALERALWVSRRFQDELGYSYVQPFAIYEREHGRGHVMYYMIHATDHPEAIPLMARAYNDVVLVVGETGIQVELF